MKNPVRLAGVLAIGLVASSLSACGGSGSGASSSGSGAYLTDGTLTVCMNSEYPPMEYREGSGSPQGFDVDLAKATAKQMGKQFKEVEVSLSGIIPALNAKRCDVAWSSLYVTPPRSAAADPVPYLKTGYTVLATASNTSITSMDTLAGKRLAYQTGSADETKLTELQTYLADKKLAAVKAIGTPAGADVVQNLLNGKADAAFQTDVSTADTLKKTAGKTRLAFTYPTDNTIGAYTNKGSQVATDLKAALAALKSDGTSAKIATTWGLNTKNLV